MKISILLAALAMASVAVAEPVRLRIGIVSDVHVNNVETRTCFVRALKMFRERNVDGVMIPGDLTKFNTDREIALLADAWQEVFPDDKAPDGHTVERLFVHGNHDGALSHECWSKYLHVDFEPIWIRKVKGYVFTGAGYGAPKWLAEFYRKHDAELRGDKPFFHIQHQHPRGTCLGDWGWGNEPCATEVLSKYPNAIAFSGHSHTPLTDERSIWQGTFTSINAGTLSHDGYSYNGRDNGDINESGYMGFCPDRLTPVEFAMKSKAGLLMTVTDSQIRLERYSFMEEKPLSLGEDWVIPVGRDAPKPYAFATRAAGRSAPEFPKGATVACSSCTAKHRCLGQSTPCLRVDFPHALPVNGCRVFEYEVTVSVVVDDYAQPVKVKRVLSPGYHLPEKFAAQPGYCLFPLGDFPAKARLRFEVRPLECFGKAGKAISTEFTLNRESKCRCVPIKCAEAGGIDPSGTTSVPTARTNEEVRLRIGIVSDIHLCNQQKKETFVQVLGFFRERNVDGVMIPGDLTDFARPREFQRVADAWREVFPDDKAPDGHTVERLFVTGNHDSGLAERPGDWKAYFHEDFAPIWIKTVKGYVFTGANWGQTEGLTDFYRKHAAAFAGDKPFFHVQHRHPRGTCLGNWAWGNEPCATKVLSEYSNAIAISGHSHYSLTDERSIWQGAFTSINAGTLSHDCHLYGTHDNGRFNGYGSQVVQPDRLTPDVGTANGKACLVMTVTDSQVRLERYSFASGKPLSLGDDWVIPVGRDAPKPYAFAARAAGRSAPVFPEGAKVTCSPCVSTSRTSRAGLPVACLKVSFPQALTVDGCRVFDYEVTASVVMDGVAVPRTTKRVLAPGYFLPAEMAGETGFCLFAADNFPPKSHLRFTVRPLECFGEAGSAISTDIEFRNETSCQIRPCVASAGDAPFSVKGVSESGRVTVEKGAVAYEQTTDAPARFSLVFDFPKWEPDTWVFMPSCAYNGNRDARRQFFDRYPPYVLGRDAGLEPERVQSQVPALEPDGSGEIEVTSGDMATPCAGFFFPKARRGVLVFTEQEVGGTNLGFTVRAGSLRIDYPANRSAAYRGIGKSVSHPDRPLALAKGTKLRSRFRTIDFEAADVSAFLERFFRERKCLLSDARAPNGYTKELWETTEKAWNEHCWVDGAYRQEIRKWVPGWTGGPNSVYPLYRFGNAQTRERCRQTLDFMMRHQAKSGFFYGRVIKDEDVVDEPYCGPRDEPNRHLVRRSADALYFLIRCGRQMGWTDAWKAGVRRCADAFVRTWRKYGQFGLWVDVEDGRILVGRSTSCALASAALYEAWKEFGDPAYREVALASCADYCSRDLDRGVTYGGPGDIIFAPDSESAFALLESCVVLAEETKDPQWLRRARQAAALCSTWVVSYRYRFPPTCTFAKLGVNTVGSVFASVQNKHAAPGICTASGDSLLRLYRLTGDAAYLELCKDIAFFLPQAVSRAERPIVAGNGRVLPPGFVSERVNMSDWEGFRNIGETFCAFCWCGTSLLTTWADLMTQPEFGAAH